MHNGIGWDLVMVVENWKQLQNGIAMLQIYLKLQAKFKHYYSKYKEKLVNLQSIGIIIT